MWGHWTRQQNWTVHGEFYFYLAIGFALHRLYIRNYYPYAFTQLLWTLRSTNGWLWTNFTHKSHFEKLTISKLVKKFSTFWGKRRFIIVFNTALRLFLSSAKYEYSTVQYSTVCTLSHSFFKTVAKHWWIQVDWKHWFNLFFPKYRKRVCSRTQWPDLSPLPTFPWHITYFLSQEVIFLKYLRILRLLTHRKIGSQTPCNRTLQNRHWLMLIKISLEQTSIRPKNWENWLAVSVQKVNIPKFSKLESTKLFKSEFCGSWVVAC